MSVFPEWFKAFKQVTLWPGMDMPVVSGHNGQIGFGQVHEDTEVPEHAHDGQWGVVLEGRVEFVIGGERRVFTKGDYYHIPAGVPHSARLAAGTAFIDVWEGQRFGEDRMR
ncbi:Quercetin 2,3-dioxygenase [Calidithermus terrae]|uniref:Quercetin 2,3-dioxygenase n=1 Tax=Calidithermus terrae TaxID=1408545 RepID=A0A399F6Z1_9DEIN|nr:cupin domain-containing protein [Calidithermus terrae]RIH90401.1 Quercetin 2,3-dioxygenase [Calidithermus terrae]